MNRYRVKPGSRVDLSEWDPNDKSGFGGSREDAQEELQTLVQDLDRLQELLYAEHKHKLLIVLQGMDAAGKDGTVRHVFSGVNPQGVRVASFKAPTPEESDHDFLWRIHKQTPGAGQIVIFNRSHYEDVLIVRVHGFISREVCRRRYTDINAFEQMVANEGTSILKFFLHIDRDEQRKRLEERLEDKTKQWKFNSTDLKERQLWPKYMRAYEDALSATGTTAAPWYIVPANRNWYRNLVISRILVKCLKDLKMAYPKSVEDLTKIVLSK